MNETTKQPTIRELIAMLQSAPNHDASVFIVDEGDVDMVIVGYTVDNGAFNIYIRETE